MVEIYGGHQVDGSESHASPLVAPLELADLVEERVEELMRSGQTRREALRRVARENMEAEIREGFADTLQSGALPNCARACGMCCGILIIILLLTMLLLCISICVCCVGMHLLGWFLTWWLLDCNDQLVLRGWLLLYQMLSLLDGCLTTLVRNCFQEFIQGLDSRVRPGFAKVCTICYTLLSSTLKVMWCIHVRMVVVDSPRKPDCGDFLPRFMGWYSCILMAQLLVVEPIVRSSASLVLWAATSGLMQTTRGAKPGTLESLQVVRYDVQVFPATEECCFCLEEYDAVNAIVRTPCQHMMHRDCLGRWLQNSHFCPICRGDLEEERSLP